MLLSSGTEGQQAVEWKQICSIQHEKPIICMASDVGDRGKPIFYTGNHAIHRVRGFTADPELKIAGSSLPIRSIQTSGDRRVAVARGNLVEIWEDSLISKLVHPEGETVTSVAWAWPIDTLISACGTEVFVWDTLSGEIVHRVAAPSMVHNVAISPDFRMFMAHTNKTYYVWSMNDFRPVEQGTVATSASMSCASLGNSRALIGCSDGQCFSIPLATSGQGQIRLWGHTKNVRSVHISKDDSRGVSGSWDCTIRVWCLHTGETLRELSDAHSAYVTVGRFLGKDDSYVVSASSDSTLRVFDLHQADRERIKALLYKSRERPTTDTNKLPVDVLRRIKQMLFGSVQDDWRLPTEGF